MLLRTILPRELGSVGQKEADNVQGQNPCALRRGRKNPIIKESTLLHHNNKATKNF